MSITNSYNNGVVRSRNITSDNTFSMGMKYTDNPLNEGYNKMLVNFQLADSGRTLKPRAGMLEYGVAGGITGVAGTAIVHHTTTALVSEYDDADATSHRYSLVGGVTNTGSTYSVLGLPTKGLKVSTVRVLIHRGGDHFVTSSVAPTVTGLPEDATNVEAFIALEPKCNSVHDMTIAGDNYEGVFATYDGITYLPMFCTYKINGTLFKEQFIATLNMKFNSAQTAVTVELVKLEAEDVSATKAVNYGYNMLKAAPFTFTNKSSSGQIVTAQGIVPYDKSGNVLVSARLGDEVTFKMFYDYPSGHSNKIYRAQWEIQNLDDAESSEVVQSALTGSDITPGGTISYWTNQTTYKQFVLVCKIYDKTDVVAAQGDGLSPIEFTIKTTPLATMSVAFYYLTEDNKSSAKNSMSTIYDIGSCKGMCTWMNRLVVWGVSNAKTTLWVSDINNPSYFPYPNNIEVFDSDIVKCLKYKNSLLVFTRTALYQLSFAEDGLTILTQCIQERLVMEEGDAATILPVQSMVFFKGDNYYYMIVPAAAQTTMAGELTLAPVSRPITDMLDHMSDTCLKLFEIVEGTDNTELALWDYSAYVEGSELRVVYKYKVTTTDDEDNATVNYYDFVLAYNIKSRAWVTYLFKTNQYRTVQFLPSVTGSSVFINAYVHNFAATFVTYVADPTICYDEFYDGEGNSVESDVFQYLDTGYRAVGDSINVNKKWRQVQLLIDNLDSEHLDFNTEFICDSDKRKKRYTYEEEFDEGVLVLTPELIDDEVPGLEDVLTEATEWGYDVTNFDDYTTGRVKININAKGRLGRFTLVSRNQSMYEIHSIAYVYRLMTAR